MTGTEQYMLYTLALTTGLRASELASLTWGDFDFTPTDPVVGLKPAYTKNRKLARIPLRMDVAAMFRSWQQNHENNEKVFATFNPNKAASMIREDLSAAEVAYQDEAGRFADFHSLRHTFITQVGKSGATMKAHQTLARHSRPELTLGIYTHLTVSDERRAVEKLPQIVNLKAEAKVTEVRLTGTDNRPVDIVENPALSLTPQLTPN